MTIKPKLKEKVIKEFYEMVIQDLKEREQMIARMTETGDLPIGSVHNEQEFGTMLTQVLNTYVLKYLRDQDAAPN